MNPNRPDSADRPERPRAEPEIIPPGAPDPRRRSAEPDPEEMPGAVFITVDQDGRTRYTKIEPPGPLAVGIGLLVLGAVAVTIMLLVLGLVLVWVPVIAAVIAVLLFSRYLKAAWQRFMGRQG